MTHYRTGRRGKLSQLVRLHRQLFAALCYSTSKEDRETIINEIENIEPLMLELGRELLAIEPLPDNASPIDRYFYESEIRRLTVAAFSE